MVLFFQFWVIWVDMPRSTLYWVLHDSVDDLMRAMNYVMIKGGIGNTIHCRLLPIISPFSTVVLVINHSIIQYCCKMRGQQLQLNANTVIGLLRPCVMLPCVSTTSFSKNYFLKYSSYNFSQKQSVNTVVPSWGIQYSL